jgi:hypothetical protein
VSPHPDHSPAPRFSGTIVTSTVIAALGGLLFGFDTAVISGTTAVLYFVSTVGSALAWDWWSFVFFRFIGGVGTRRAGSPRSPAPAPSRTPGCALRSPPPRSCRARSAPCRGRWNPASSVSRAFRAPHGGAWDGMVATRARV